MTGGRAWAPGGGAPGTGGGMVTLTVRLPSSLSELARLCAYWDRVPGASPEVGAVVRGGTPFLTLTWGGGGV